MGRPAVWTRDRIIAAIRDWAERHDGRPPSVGVWNRPGGSGKGVPLTDRPSMTAVYCVFGGRPADGQLSLFGAWSEAILAAGYEPLAWRNRTGHRRVLCMRRLHELAGANLIVQPNGKRACRACKNTYDRRHKRDLPPLPFTRDEARAELRCSVCNFDPAVPGRLLCDHCAHQKV